MKKRNIIKTMISAILVASFVMACGSEDNKSTTGQEETSSAIVLEEDSQQEMLMKTFVFSWGYNQEVYVDEKGDVIVDVYFLGDQNLEVEYGFMFFFNGKPVKCLDEAGNEVYIYTAIAEIGQTNSKKITVKVDGKYYDDEVCDFRTIAINFPNYKVNEKTYSYGNYGRISQFGGRDIKINLMIEAIESIDESCDYSELSEKYKEMYRIDSDSKYFNIISEESQLENSVKLKMNDEDITNVYFDGIGKGEYYLSAYVNGQLIPVFNGNESMYISIDEKKMAKLNVKLDRNEYREYLNEEGYGTFYIIAVPKDPSYDVFKSDSFVIR